MASTSATTVTSQPICGRKSNENATDINIKQLKIMHSFNSKGQT